MAIDLTGISNVNEFYSHHYLDSLLEGDLKGLFSKWKEAERTPDKRLAGLGGEYFKAKSNALNEVADIARLEYTQPFHCNLLEALGYSVRPAVKYTHEGRALSLLNTITRDGNEHIWMIQVPFASDDISVLEQKMVNKSNLEEEEKQLTGSVEEIIQEIFRLEEPPRWLMLLAGQKVYLIDRAKWGQGKYLLFDLDEIFGRKQAETLKSTAALLSKDALAPDEGMILHDELDEKSHKHAFSVSEDLKYGIRRAVELIGNEFIYYRSQVAKKKLYGDEELATKLTSEALNYLYRLLFLFYAESRSEELNVVPMKSEEYRLGYSLESLRELEQVPLTTEAARNGHYLHDSLTMLFKVVNEGYGDIHEQLDLDRGGYLDVGFEIDGVHSPLFDLKQTPLLSSVKVRNFVLQEVIQLLSLSKEGGKQRGRISYAQLGINQLGAVYEGLLSYSGFFAQETLFEVKPADMKSTDETGQSYFVPESEIEQYHEDEFVYVTDVDGTKKRKKYEKGSFIFRLAGRDREKSASYYTPEVLTKSLVKYSLKELLKDKEADDILKLTVCEPAMGSGAFLNEAINQLADAYLERKQQELGETIGAEDYAYERQKVKAYIATNNVYGVDLNPTATELAKVSLWLNTIYKGGETPWFSSRLAVGNSLVGARRRVYKGNDLINGKWHKISPKKITSKLEREKDEIYHFLIPDKGMVPFDTDKVVKDIAKVDIDRMKNWRNEFTKKLDMNEVETLVTLSKRIDSLWHRHLENRRRLSEIVKEQIDIWGHQSYENKQSIVSIHDKEEELKRIKESPTSPYRLLKTIMDYWCSLWFWPVEESMELPTRDEFILDISVILDSANGYGPNIEDVLDSVNRLKIMRDISQRVGFFHWELEFVEVYGVFDGFHLVLGNPPWIKLTWEEKGTLSEKEPLINLRDLTATRVAKIRNELLTQQENKLRYLKEFTEIMGQKSFLGSTLYQELEGIQLNLYKTFIVLGLDIANKSGVVSFLHLEGIYDDAQGGALRRFLYKKLIYHFQFVNELKLFAEVYNRMKFSISVFSPNEKNKVNFINISNLFHPRTIEECFIDNGLGMVPGIKSTTFDWELKGHRNRVIRYNENLLGVINNLFENEGTNLLETKLVSIHSAEIINVLKKLSENENNLTKFKNDIIDTVMFDETNDQKDNKIIRRTSNPETLSELVLSGPHIYVANPLFQTPNANCKNHRDYSRINLVDVDQNYIPRTNYEITEKGASTVQYWNNEKITGYYRQIFRKMLSSANERTLIGAIIPDGPTHINGCISLAFKDPKLLAIFSGVTSSLVHDFYIKSTGRTNLSKVLYNLPLPNLINPLNKMIISRVLRLNCLTEYYQEIWKDLFDVSFKNDSFSKQDSRLSEWDYLNSDWKPTYPLRNEFERRQALIELDVISALVLSLSIEELLTIYRVQFPVLQKYEAEKRYDQRGMLVSNTAFKYYAKNHGSVDVQDSNLEGFIPPFDKCNREADYRQAYEHFSKILRENN
ncbi:Eco57I restriction-modification methylase domain-containing protein [Priestia megaterium]|uniref:Eco57I restriction-modification methylase domain-containing protein n=1 Tax=Priestia megaterium TaxID=1404 RepID=UPI00336B7F70